MRPSSPDRLHAAAADLAACRVAIRTGSRSFHAASRLLPDRVAGPAIALYAFCRTADDAVDGPGGGAAVLERLTERLDRVYAGRPADFAADRAFADMVALHDLPRALPEALLEGFAWDVAGGRYADLPALLAYATRVAGSVGAMMAVVMGVRSPAVLARACELGVAMQLSNIARDVGADAAAGRLYLPLEWLAEAGLAPDALLRQPMQSPALTSVVTRLLAEADTLYARADAGIAALPLVCRPGIAAARLLYAAIGDAVRRGGADPARRARVPGYRKLGLLAQVPAHLSARQPAIAPAPLPAVAFLVDAACHAHALSQAAPWRIGDRFVWLLDLFERLERISLAQRGG